MSTEPKPPAPHAAGPDPPVAGRDSEGNWLARRFRQNLTAIVGLLCTFLLYLAT